MPVIDVTQLEYPGEYVNEEAVIEADNTTDMDIFLDTICASADCYNESAISDIKNRVSNVSDLYKQWKKYTNTFVKHKWIHRYINEKQKAALQKHYETLRAEKVNYSTYKRSFAAICKFFGLPTNTIIIENITFSKDRQDREQDIVSVGYSKGLVKVTIPEGIRLIHVTPVDVDELKPSFRSKVVGKYLYPTKRVYFTCIKVIEDNKAGLEGKKSNKYTPKTPITTAYIDPACSEFSYNAVYVETDTPIPVEKFSTFKDKIKDKLSFNKHKDNEKED